MSLVSVANSLEHNRGETNPLTLSTCTGGADLGVDGDKHMELQHDDFFGIEIFILPESHIYIFHE